MRTLTINVFPGAMNLPLWAAIAQGFFAERNLAMEIVYTPNSVAQLTGMMAGEFDLALTAIDNVIAYREGQGEVAVAGDRELVAVLGSDDAFLRLVVQPDIRCFEDLRGQVLTADALTTGFAFVLRRMLALNGIRDEEVTWLSTGGVMQRWQAMMARPEQKGTLQVTPFEILGAPKGHHVLARAADVLESYQGVVGVTRRAWAEANGDDLAAFIAAYLKGVAWCYGAGADACADIITANMPQMPHDVAAGACTVFLDPVRGYRRDGGFDMAGIATVLDLRREFGPDPDALHGPEHYIDTTWLERARAL